MRRTTVSFDDQILRELKQQAAKEGLRLGQLIERYVRLARRRPSAKNVPLDLPTVAGAPAPGVDLTDREALDDLMDGR